MKGIVLAGGAGTRLHPVTLGISKQLLCVYDKPMIYYPISTLMLAGIQEILIITTPEDQQNFVRLLGDGSRFGVKFTYAVQPKPEGIAQAFLIGKNFIGKDSVALILGDNIFYGEHLKFHLTSAMKRKTGATIFSTQVSNPECFGVLKFKGKDLIGIEEKPVKPKTNCIVTGLYFYDNDVIRIAETIKPSTRGELEITDVNNCYLQAGKLNVEFLDKAGYLWFDSGTVENMFFTTDFIRSEIVYREKQIGCLEEIAHQNNWLTAEEIRNNCSDMLKTEYGNYLIRMIEK